MFLCLVNPKASRAKRIASTVPGECREVGGGTHGLIDRVQNTINLRWFESEGEKKQNKFSFNTPACFILEIIVALFLFRQSFVSSERK